MTNLVVSNTHTVSMAAFGTFADCWHGETKQDGQAKLLNRKPKPSAARETRS